MVRDAHEFKPLLAEIEDAPVSPLGRLTFWLVVSIFVMGVMWLCLGEVDVVVTAPGQVIPQGNSKIVQPLETGVLKAIQVKEGDFVHQGDVLLVIDPDSVEPVLNASGESQRYTKQEIQRVKSELSGKAFQGNSTQEALLQASRMNLISQRHVKEQEFQQVSAEITTAIADRTHFTETIKMARDKLQRINTVRDIVAKVDVEQAEEAYLSNQNRLQEANNRLEGLQHRQLQLSHEIQVLEEGHDIELLNTLSEREKRAIELEAQVKEASFKRTQQTLRAPVDGYVDTLFVHTLGGVVTPAEKLLSIVPVDAKLVIQGSVSNKDIGYIKTGEKVTIKVDTFDFQKYGTLPGRITLISHDSHVSSGESKGPEETGIKVAETSYTVYIQPLKTRLRVNGKQENLRTGMTVVNEIRVGKRRIIEFFIYPIVKSLHDSVKLR